MNNTNRKTLLGSRMYLAVWPASLKPIYHKRPLIGVQLNTIMIYHVNTYTLCCHMVCVSRYMFCIILLWCIQSYFAVHHYVLNKVALVTKSWFPVLFRHLSWAVVGVMYFESLNAWHACSGSLETIFFRRCLCRSWLRGWRNFTASTREQTANSRHAKCMRICCFLRTHARHAGADSCM